MLISLKERFRISVPVFIVGIIKILQIVFHVLKNTVLNTIQIIYASKIRRSGINCIYKLHAMNIFIIDVKPQKVVNVGVINKKKKIKNESL